MKIDSLKILLAVQFAAFIALVLDIPIIRQVMVFVYLSFLPGFLLSRILKLDSKGRVDTILYSVGLSIAFLMFVGLTVNELYPLAGLTQPLSTPLLSATIGVFLILLTISSRKRLDSPVPSFPTKTKISRGILFFVVPLLAIVGAWTTNSQILLLMVVAVSLLVMFVGFSEKIIPPSFYPIALIAVALSLLFPIAFISNHLVGYDIFGESYVFRLTQTSSLWNPVSSSVGSELLDYNGMLSVTVLPTIYSNLMNLSGEWVFKIVYLLFYALVPLTLYKTFEGSFGKSAAFLSAFYFILFPRFYMEERRQIIGELFLVLLLFTILKKDLSPRKKQILIVAFGGALVVSHYSLSYIFLFSILAAWGITSIVKALKLKQNLTERKVLTSGIVLLIAFFNFSWYFLATPAVSATFLGFISHAVDSFTTGFTSLGSRGETVSEFLAPNLSGYSLVAQADYAINKIPYFLIIVGFLLLVINFRKMQIQFEYLPIASANLIMLILALALPAVAPAFLAHRFFHVALLFLAPICVLGGMTLLKWIAKPFTKMKDSHRFCVQVMCVFFVMIFLFKVGFVSQVTGDFPINIPMSYTRMITSQSPLILDALYEPYVPQQDVNSAVWLSNFASGNTKIYADEIARKHVLATYGMVITDWDLILKQNTTIHTSDAYIYLRTFNLYGLITQDEKARNATQIFGQLDLTNKIYSNGDSEIYRTVSEDNTTVPT